MTLAILTHRYNGAVIGQRVSDQYINATAMCAANGRDFHDYTRLRSTKAFVEALSVATGIPGQKLIITGEGRTGGNSWVHPKVAIHMGQWCSPEFAVWVTELVFNSMGSSQPVPVVESKPNTEILSFNRALLRIVDRLLARNQDSLTDKERAVIFQTLELANQTLWEIQSSQSVDRPMPKADEKSPIIRPNFPPGSNHHRPGGTIRADNKSVVEFPADSKDSFFDEW